MNFWPSLELLRERFDSPRIATDTLKKWVDIEIGIHRDIKKDPNAIFHALGEFARRGKESPVLTELTDQELTRLGRDGLERLLRHVFDYKRRVGYAGVRNPGEIAKLLEERGSFRKPPKQGPVVYLKPLKPMVYFVHRDMMQARVGVFGSDGVLAPARILDGAFWGNYMGGGMSAVIFQEIRESRALAYSAGGGYALGSYRGDENNAHGALGCQADKTLEAAELLRSLISHPR